QKLPVHQAARGLCEQRVPADDAGFRNELVEAKAFDLKLLHDPRVDQRIAGHDLHAEGPGAEGDRLADSPRRLAPHRRDQPAVPAFCMDGSVVCDDVAGRENLAERARLIAKEIGPDQNAGQGSHLPREPLVASAAAISLATTTAYGDSLALWSESLRDVILDYCVIARFGSARRTGRAPGRLDRGRVVLAVVSTERLVLSRSGRRV